MKKIRINKICITGLCLAIGLILPFITGQIKEVGNMLCPMHIPVIICGFICGPIYGALLGMVTPLLRSLIFTMPTFYPLAISMSVELCIYGFVSGAIYNFLIKKNKENKLSLNIIYVYISLIIAMILGRVGWGLTRYLLTLIDETMKFSKEMFISGALLTAWPGILIQLILIPLIIISLTNNRIIPLKEGKKYD